LHYFTPSKRSIRSRGVIPIQRFNASTVQRPNISFFILPSKFAGVADYFAWTVQVHNEVNRLLGKPELSGRNGLGE
jgi:hypothetical protein